MNRWTQLATAQVPGSGTELRLLQRADEFSIRLTGYSGDLMSSRQHGSEDQLATLACARLAGRKARRVLVGGLGMGHTLAAALAALGPDDAVRVVELVPEVVAWNRDLFGAVAGHPLSDRRVTVETGDVVASIRAGKCAYDAILLDVDNGPEGLTRRSNDYLYSLKGLAEAWAALRPKGILAVWSAGPDRDFVRRLQRADFAVDEQRVHAHGSKGRRHFIWLAQRR